MNIESTTVEPSNNEQIVEKITCNYIHTLVLNLISYYVFVMLIGDNYS